MENTGVKCDVCECVHNTECNKCSLPEITKMLDVDSLHYLSIDGLLRSVMQSDSYCLACFDGKYPVPCRESGKLRLECGGCCGSR